MPSEGLGIMRQGLADLFQHPSFWRQAARKVTSSGGSGNCPPGPRSYCDPLLSPTGDVTSHRPLPARLIAAIVEVLGDLAEAAIADVSVDASGKPRKLKARPHRSFDPPGAASLTVQMRSHVCAYANRPWLNVVQAGLCRPHEAWDRQSISDAIDRPISRRALF